jgi:rod shape-determining protein MreB
METLSQTPELAADIYNTGIYLAGGGSMLRGLDKNFSKNRLTCLHCRRSLRAVVEEQVWRLKPFEI